MMPVDAVVMDIEGTTTSIDFVTSVLYPYARERLPNFVRQHRGESDVAEIMDEARDAGGVWNDEAVLVRLCHWMERDQKVTPLKTLQGLIWEEGYRGGELISHVYPDVAPALRAWHAQGIRLYIYSSGSAHAQRLIYGHTVAGDLTPLLSGYFDTHIGQSMLAWGMASLRNGDTALASTPRLVHSFNAIPMSPRPAWEVMSASDWVMMSRRNLAPIE